MTQLEIFYLAKKLARRMSADINSDWGEVSGLPITPEDVDIWLDTILDKLLKYERGNPVGEPPDPLLAQALVHLRNHGAVDCPAVPPRRYQTALYQGQGQV